MAASCPPTCAARRCSSVGLPRRKAFHANNRRPSRRKDEVGTLGARERGYFLLDPRSRHSELGHRLELLGEHLHEAQHRLLAILLHLAQDELDPLRPRDDAVAAASSCAGRARERADGTRVVDAQRGIRVHERWTPRGVYACTRGRSSLAAFEGRSTAQGALGVEHSADDLVRNRGAEGVRQVFLWVPSTHARE